MGWITDRAPTAAELAACVECGLCLPHCPTFRLTGDETASPRGRLNAMAAVAAGEVEIDATFAGIMDFCLQCRACEAACPSLVPFGRAMEGARSELAVARPSSGRLRRRIAGRWVARRRLVGTATTGAALVQRIGVWAVPQRVRTGIAGLRRLPFRRGSVLGYRSTGSAGTVGLLAGCVMDPWFVRVHLATIALLEAAGYGVVVPEEQTCCGALAAHEGAAAEALEMAARNDLAFRGVDWVVANAAGCSAHLAGYGHWGGASIASRAVDALQLVVDAIRSGVLPTLPPTGVRVAVQDPCHHRHAQRIVTEPRLVLRAAGYEPIDIDEDALCCGAAGMYSVTRPETSRALGEAKASQVITAGCDTVASANPGCEIQLRAHLGDSVRAVHPLEIYAEALGLIRRAG